MITTNPLELRQAIDYELGMAISDATWEWLVGEDVPNKVATGKLAVSQVVPKVREVLEKAGVYAPNQPTRKKCSCTPGKVWLGDLPFPLKRATSRTPSEPLSEKASR